MKFHLLAISSSLILGAGLSAIQPGNFFVGWLVFTVLFLVAHYAIRSTQVHRYTSTQVATQHATRTAHPLTPILYTAFLLRLALGVTFLFVLPQQPNPGVDHRNGYIYFDAYRRDSQAWDLARSGEPILNAFNKNYFSDQYGGLLAINASAYRYLSPDAQRPLLPILLAALAATLGLPFLWKSAEKLWGKKVALFAVWIYALYPESILLGSSQMREPFLMMFMAMALWGFVAWRASGLDTVAVELPAEPTGIRRLLDQRNVWLWLVLGFLGMLLISPAIALLTLVLFAGWIWVTREHGRFSWAALAIIGLVFVAGLYLLAWGLEREQPLGASPFGIIMNWSRDAVNWDTYQLERGSGWVQKLFSEMPEGLRPLFVMVYGLTQPVLPATFVEPTTPVMRALGIFRAAGWYALVPLLFYAPFAASRATTGGSRRLWLWLTALVWLWSIVSALRGGADLWDNPRYRTMLIVVESLVAAFAWVHRDRWLARWLVLEVVFLAFFTYWYAHRYFYVGVEIPFSTMVALIFVCAALILGGGWWWDRRSTDGGAKG